MNKTNHIANQAHQAHHQPVEGAGLQVDLGPAADLLHLLAANWLMITLVVCAVLGVGYLLNWGAAAGVKAVTPAKKTPFGNPNAGFSGIGSLILGTGGILMLFYGLVFGFQSAFAPAIGAFQQAVTGILGG